MLDYVYGHDATVAHFVAQLIPALQGRDFPPSARAFGVIDAQGRLIAGMVFHNYDPGAGVIEMSGAALPGVQWLSRGTLQRMYVYPFVELGCQMVLMRISARDRRLLRQLQALNYQCIEIPRLMGRDHDAMVCLLTRERWIASKFQRRLKHYAQPVQLELQLDEAA